MRNLNTTFLISRSWGRTACVFALLASMALAMCVQAVASDKTIRLGPIEEPYSNIFAFGGRYTTGDTGESLEFSADFEDNFVVAVGHQRYFLGTRWGSVGTEAGIGVRFGEKTSAELWGGATLRGRGLVFFDTVALTPSVIVGLSAVTDSMGLEAIREGAHPSRDATLLYYLGLELAASMPANPQWEMFWRLHHRSGGGGTLGGLGEGHNAHVLGLRRRF